MANQAFRTRDWSGSELTELDAAPLIHVVTARADGTPRTPVLIGHVRVDGDEFIRSLNGTRGAWYRAAIRAGRGEVEVGGRRIEVAFLPDTDHGPEVDDALRSRYGNDSGVRRMVAASAQEATLRVRPLL